MATNYSILVDVQLQTQQIQKQLDAASRKIRFNINSKQNLKDLTLEFNAANEVFSQTTTVITSLVEQVKELDDALTEYKKVSDLSGEALDNYVSKLSEMGLQVGRTGKPNRSEPVCTNGKCA